MKTCNIMLSLVITVSSMQSFANSGASEHGSAASKHSALVASHGTAASAKVGSAVLATPLIVVGAHAVAEPLEITDKTITVALSPKQMMKTAVTEEL